MQKDKKALSLYLIIVFMLSAAVETVWIIYGQTATQAGISTLLMMIPFIIAVILARIFFKKQGSLGFKRCKFIYILLSFVLPLVYLGLSYGLYWLFDNGAFSGTPTVLIETAAAYSGQQIPDNIGIIIALIVTLPVSIITALGEEAGWRGFMYPIMQRQWGWKKAMIVSGAVWALWHLPIILAGLYYPSDTSWIYMVPIFLIEISALTVIITWLRMASKSVWPAILLHAFHNYLDQIVFQSFTNSEGRSSVYYVGEIGIITLLITVFIAVFILIKGRKIFADNHAT